MIKFFYRDYSIMNEICAPGVEYNNGSCIDLDILILIAEDYNRTNPNTRIILNRNNELSNPNNYKQYLVNQLSKKLNNKCKGDQQCWLDNLSDNDNIRKLRKRINNIFPPNGPAGQFTWLNTININQVLEMYEDKIPGFKSLGAVPIDFYEINYTGIQDINLKELYNKNIRKLGLVMNTDKHNQSGSHWIALYCEFDKNDTTYIYFFDSYGTRPNKYVQEYINLLKAFGESLGNKVVIDYNKKQHQKGGSECGMYCLYFIINMADGASFNEFNAKRIPDELVNKYRCKFMKSKWCSKLQ